MSSPAQYRDEAEWLEVRKTAIGGSDAAAIVGQDPYRSAIDVYREKIGETEPREATPQMQRGKILEPVVVELYAKLTGNKVRRQPQRRHPSYPFIIGNLDRQVLASETRPTGLLEVKCPSMRVFLRYQREGLPSNYIVQGQHYLGVFDYEWMDFAIFNADLWRLIHFEIKRDDAFIAGLFEQETRFWREHVELRVPPKPVQAVMDVPGIKMPEVAGAIVQRDDAEWAEAAQTFSEVRTLLETAEGMEEQAKAKLKELLGGYGVAEGANLRVYSRQMPGRKTFDRGALERSQPLDRSKAAVRLAHYFEHTPTAAWSAGEIVSLLKECTIDFSAYEKVGKPFDEFRGYVLKPVGDEEADE